MEFHGSNNGNNHNSNNIYMWECQVEDLFWSRDSADDVLFSFRDGMSEEDDNLIYLLGDQTPIRDCRELSYNVLGVESSSRKEVECEKSSLVNRRRMLQYGCDDYEREGIENGQTTFNVTSKVTESSMSIYSSEERLQQNTQESSCSSELCDVAPTIKNGVSKETTNLAS